MKSLVTRMTQKGQVTIPAEVRALLGLKPRENVEFEVEGDRVVIKPFRSKLLAGYGAVKPRQRPEDFAKIREETERLIGEDAAAEGR